MAGNFGSNYITAVNFHVNLLLAGKINVQCCKFAVVVYMCIVQSALLQRQKLILLVSCKFTYVRGSVLNL